MSFEIRFEGSVSVNRSKMGRMGIPNEGPACRKPRDARAMLTRGTERRLRETK